MGLNCNGISFFLTENSHYPVEFHDAVILGQKPPVSGHKSASKYMYMQIL